MFLDKFKPFYLPLFTLSFCISLFSVCMLFYQQTRMVELSKQIHRHQEHLSQRRSLESELSFYTTTQEQWIQNFPISPSPDLTQKIVKKWINQYFFSHSDLSLISISQDDAVKNFPQFFQTHLLLECVGPYKDILQLIYDFGEKESFISIQSLKIKNVHDTSLLCILDINFLIKKNIPL